jgi:hypothetical protein
MDDTAKRLADERTDQAIGSAPFEDFREAYRERLRWLKDGQPQGFTRALSHYNDILVPNIAAGADPLIEWMEYGRLLGNLSGAGKVMRIDETGRAFPAVEATEGLILHLPEDTNVPALALAVPKALSDAQKATLSLLIKGISSR